MPTKTEKLINVQNVLLNEWTHFKIILVVHAFASNHLNFELKIYFRWHHRLCENEEIKKIEWKTWIESKLLHSLFICCNVVYIRRIFHRNVNCLLDDDDDDVEQKYK